MQISLLNELLRKIGLISDSVEEGIGEVSEATEENADVVVADEEPPEELPTAEQVVDGDLAELKETFPEMTEADSITEINNPTRYAALRDLGLSATEAYLATSKRGSPDNRSHLTSGIPGSAKAPSMGMTRAQMEEARTIFRGMSDAEIQKLYQKVIK